MVEVVLYCSFIGLPMLGWLCWWNYRGRKAAENCYQTERFRRKQLQAQLEIVSIQLANQAYAHKDKTNPGTDSFETLTDSQAAAFDGLRLSRLNDSTEIKPFKA